MGKKESIKIINKFLNKLKNYIDIKEIILFGSRVRGTEKKR